MSGSIDAGAAVAFIRETERVAGERDLNTLLAAMRPELRPGAYVFTTTRTVPDDATPVMVFHEDEGTTLVLEKDQADRFDLSYDYAAAMITLRVHSALDAVGMTAAVAERLARAGISCNVVAAYYHDHVFVPFDKGEVAVQLLRELQG